MEVKGWKLYCEDLLVNGHWGANLADYWNVNDDKTNKLLTMNCILTHIIKNKFMEFVDIFFL